MSLLKKLNISMMAIMIGSIMMMMHTFIGIIVMMIEVINGLRRVLEERATDITTLASPNIEFDPIVIITIVLIVPIAIIVASLDTQTHYYIDRIWEKR